MQTSQKSAAHVIRGEAPSSSHHPRGRPGLLIPVSLIPDPQVWAGFPHAKGLETEGCFAECEVLTTLRSEGQLSPWVQGTQWAGDRRGFPRPASLRDGVLPGRDFRGRAGPRPSPSSEHVTRLKTRHTQFSATLAGPAETAGPRPEGLPSSSRPAGTADAGLYLINGRFLRVLDGNVF